jgi:broad specificity phosphatase PhoE
MDMVTNLFLVRHGETSWNRARRFQGQTDIPLNEAGLKQAMRLPDWFQNKSIDIIYSSDLCRAYETARPLAEKYGIPLVKSSYLRERGYGKLEGMYDEQVLSSYGTTNSNELEKLVDLNVESYANLQERMYNLIHSVASEHPAKNIVIVSHGGAINAFLSLISQGMYGTGINKLDNTGVTHVQFSEDAWRILVLNDTSHLVSDGLNDVS